MTPPTAPDPPGAQAERTRLAWIRTAITLMISSVIGLRVSVGHLGITAIVITAVCLVAAGFVVVLSRYRYQRAANAMDAPAHLPDGRLPGLAAVVVLALGVLVLVYGLA